MLNIIDCDIFKSGINIIIHQVNCKGVMGSGIAKTVKELYPSIYLEYRRACLQSPDSSKLLGDVFVGKAKGVTICNMFSQDGYGKDGKIYTDYQAMKLAFESINKMFRGAEIAIPFLIGCDRGGGDWEVVSKLIEDSFADCKITVCKYKG